MTVRNITIPTTARVILLRSVNGWLTILARIDINFPTGLAYAMYQSGFGDITSNFWLGLENVYLLTNGAVNGGQKYLVRFEILTTDNM
jgi:hypothetical protein